jgi:hypothetical protein
LTDLHSAPRPYVKDRTLSVSLGVLLLAGGLALAKGLGQGLAHLQASPYQITTFYAAVLVYEYAALPITGAIFLAWVVLVAIGLRRLRQPQGWRNALIAVGVTSLALLWAGLSTLPQLFVGYGHLNSMTMGADDYHLGIRTALDGDFFFVVTRCPHRQLRCAAYGATAVNVAERDDLSHVRLALDSTQALVIQTPSRTIPVTFPPP